MIKESMEKARDWLAGYEANRGPDLPGDRFGMESLALLLDSERAQAQEGRCDCKLDGNPIRPETKYIHECQWHAEVRAQAREAAYDAGRRDERSKFAMYEMVHQYPDEPDKAPRYKVYGIYEDGVRVQIDAIYLRDIAVQQTEKERDEARAALDAARRVKDQILETLRGADQATANASAAGQKWMDRAEAAEARLREVEQESDERGARARAIIAEMEADVPQYQHDYVRAEAAEAQVRELRAALAKIHGSFGNAAYSGQHHTLCNWARMDDPTQTYCNCGLNDVRTLLARTETPK